MCRWWRDRLAEPARTRTARSSRTAELHRQMFALWSAFYQLLPRCTFQVGHHEAGRADVWRAEQCALRAAGSTAAHAAPEGGAGVLCQLRVPRDAAHQGSLEACGGGYVRTACLRARWGWPTADPATQADGARAHRRSRSAIHARLGPGNGAHSGDALRACVRAALNARSAGPGPAAAAGPVRRFL
jgi:hypothetical protein